MREQLPAPDDGWPHVVRQAVAVAVLWAVATFGIAAVAMPVMDPQCYSDEIGRVCPRDPDPAITHMFDVRWPHVPEAWGVPVIVLSLLIGIGLALLLDTSEPWSDSGGAPTAAGGISGLLGAGLGLLIAGPGFVHPLPALGCTVIGALLVMLGLLAARGFRRALLRRHARHLRRVQLGTLGTRTIATVVGLDWQRTYREDDAVFAVTARFGAAPHSRTVIEELHVPREHAPVVGGTVVVIHDEQTEHESGIDVILEPDADGPRDPDALEKYPPAPEDSPS